MNEFELITAYFKPLAAGFSGSLDLSDDAAIIAPLPGQELVVTTDAICSGIHFMGTESPSLIAQKALRTNLSDLAAMGATPMAYLLSLQLPKDSSHEWVKEFAEGLQKDQELFGIHLAGGDTTSTKGPMSCSITAFGVVPIGKALKRSTARVSDVIYVSGTLGDSALGLHLLKHPNKHQDAFLLNRYLLPQPRTTLGPRLLSSAHAAMDISDGLLQDMGHICNASGVGAILRRDHLPISHAASTLIQTDQALWEAVYAGGDDYELLFTAPEPKQAEIATLADELKIPITAIGHITEGEKVLLLDEAGKEIPFDRKGFMHFR